MVCIICESKKTNIIYNGYLRTGSFGKSTNEKHNVYHCSNCNTRFLQNRLADDYYQTSDYREDYNDSLNINKFHEEHDLNDTNKVTKITFNRLRDQIVADFGTGPGTFLEIIHSVANYTIAIEPTKHFHNSLQKYNKHVFSYANELVESGIKIDIATSFDVLEHVPSPLEYLTDIYTTLKDGGKLYLKTPNFNDILHELTADKFDPFNYRTAHLFYFDALSLEYLLKKAGFKKYSICYSHDYDISNLLMWIKESKPTGLNKIDSFDNGFNLLYKEYLEKNGKASHLWIEATK